MSTKLMEEIMSDANLDLARKAVKKNKGDCETDGMTGADLDKFIEENKNQICEQIRKRQYRPLPVRRKENPKPDGSVRKLGIPCVIERWIQQAAYQVLCSIFEQVFSETSYEFRPGRRCENAIIKALEYFNDRIRGWINYFRIAKGIKEKIKSIDSHVRFRLRMCIWKLWKTLQTRRKALVKLGVAKEQAYMWSYSLKKYARVASSPIMTMTVTPAILRLKGLIFLTEYYQQQHAAVWTAVCRTARTVV